ncbi:MAG: homocysteine S-methyltransferase family protein [Lachnospiraceae bacterium]|nr:homocysteine S-methyltransferase family protein [Lachnospiraceae bacterium]
MNFPFSLPFFLDGATGTELLKRGMKEGDCTERFILENKEVFQQLQKEYIAAGASALLAPTFGANLPTLLRHGFAEEEADDTVKALVAVTKEIAGDTVKVGGDLSPTGLLIKPFGNTEPEEVIAIYQKEAKALLEAGVDFFFVETMISAAEAKLAVTAIRELSKEIPVFVSLTVEKSGRTMSGDLPAAALLSLSALNIAAFGCNCSVGPDVVLNALTPAAPCAKALGIPMSAKPNAGMPENGVYPVTPEALASFRPAFEAIGAELLGGCCGTTPDHIRAISSFEGVPAGSAPLPELPPLSSLVSTSRRIAEITGDTPVIPIGADSEDDILDLADEYDPDEALILELSEGAAEVLIAQDAFLPNPYRLTGDENEIAAVERALCRKVR